MAGSDDYVPVPTDSALPTDVQIAGFMAKELRYLKGHIASILATLTAFIARTDNPHAVTKAQVGLSALTNAISDSVVLDSSATLASSKAVYDLNNALTTGLSSTSNIGGLDSSLAALTASVATKASKSANLTDLDSVSDAFNNIKQSATTTSAGVVEEATTTEMTAGSADKFPDCATVKAYIDSLTTTTVLATPVGSSFIGTVRCTRVGNVVTISGDSLTHNSISSVNSATNFIPVEYMPSDSTSNCYYDTGSSSRMVSVDVFLRRLEFRYNSLRTSTGGWSITYLV